MKRKLTMADLRKVKEVAREWFALTSAEKTQREQRVKDAKRGRR